MECAGTQVLDGRVGPSKGKAAFALSTPPRNRTLRACALPSLQHDPFRVLCVHPDGAVHDGGEAQGPRDARVHHQPAQAAAWYQLQEARAARSEGGQEVCGQDDAHEGRPRGREAQQGALEQGHQERAHAAAHQDIPQVRAHI